MVKTLVIQVTHKFERAKLLAQIKLLSSCNIGSHIISITLKSDKLSRFKSVILISVYIIGRK